MDTNTKKCFDFIFKIIISSIECKNKEALIDLVKSSVENDINVSQLLENNKFLFNKPEQKSYSIDDDFYGYVTWINCLTNENFIETVIQNFNDNQFIQMIKEMIEKDLLEPDKKKLAEQLIYKENSNYHFINSSLNSQLKNEINTADYLDFKNSIEEEFMKNSLVEDMTESNLKSSRQLVNTQLYDSMLNDYINEKVNKHIEMIKNNIHCDELSLSFDSEQLVQKELDKVILPQVEQQTVVMLISDEGKIVSIYSKKPNISVLYPPKNNTMLLFNENGKQKECKKSSFLFINNNQINFYDGLLNSFIELNDGTIDTEFKGEILDFIGVKKWKTVRVVVYNKSPKSGSDNTTDNTADNASIHLTSNTKTLKDVLEKELKLTNTKYDYNEIKGLHDIKSTEVIEIYVQVENNINIIGLLANKKTVCFFEYEIDKLNSQRYTRKPIRYFQKSSYNNFSITPPDPVISFDTPGFILTTPLFSISDQLTITKYPFNLKLYSPTFETNSFFISGPTSQRVKEIAYRFTEV
ncbi:hypothetical protein EDI_070910 [Entamoeba dispar SAW760]|uniref:Uncharacterized protein n=1 Tax=Entamoeba dispar (strain ATCC PRA-260 / SAW760) TaxID=370354 RepID=B0EMD1_ENTDS|nr:uncharacterized protein EDI_070910 [Entamoeba dispar SAW760]EDR24349.1 hypothetical protein EDI_070910 [Entamoeba dispar SAW760]|eukprot:EDR24349.1 hypothetical protein EDI_070910 [Entamoeba dispar SAW760]